MPEKRNCKRMNGVNKKKENAIDRPTTQQIYGLVLTTSDNKLVTMTDWGRAAEGMHN